MLKKALIALAAVVLLLVGVVAAQPSEYQVARSRVVQAPPAVVYAEVEDFKRWVAWSPWEKMEPNVQHTYSEPPSGVGATTTWKGEKTGSGAMKFTEATPPSHLGIQLDFLEPFPSSSVVAFDFAPEGAGTKVTWSMKGKNDFLGKAFGLFVNMDEMIGKDFENGLADIARVSEAAAAKAPAPPAEAPPADAAPAPEAAPAP